VAQMAEAQIARPEATASAETARLARLALAAAPPPAAPQVTRVAVLDPPPGPPGGQPAPPRPPLGAPGAPPSLTDPQRGTLHDYLQCQLAGAKALDDGHSSEDAIATKLEQRCETQYQAYRQTWMARTGPGTPDERAWNMDNSRQERARVAVHASRQAMVRIADIKSCVRLVANQFGSEPFDEILDQGVLRCGALIPFPVPPRGLETAMTDQQIQDRKERQDRTTRLMIATDLKQIVEAKSSQPQ
jgi:hypothetical protein